MPITIQVMKWASDGIAISGLWTIASRLIRVARDVAQANADGVLREAQHDVISVDNMMGSDFATGAILTVDGWWRRTLSGKGGRSAPLTQRRSNACRGAGRRTAVCRTVLTSRSTASGWSVS